VTGRENIVDQEVSSLDLVNDINRWLHSPEGLWSPSAGDLQTGSTVPRPRELWSQHSDSIFYAKDLKETRKLIDEKIKPDDILLIMGAGDIYKIADELVI